MKKLLKKLVINEKRKEICTEIKLKKNDDRIIHRLNVHCLAIYVENFSCQHHIFLLSATAHDKYIS